MAGPLRRQSRRSSPARRFWLRRCLRIANSAAFGIHGEINTIADAVAYLGFSTTKALFLRLKVDTIFPQISASGCYDGKKLWSHSVAVAQTAD